MNKIKHTLLNNGSKINKNDNLAIGFNYLTFNLYENFRNVHASYSHRYL